MAATRNKSLKCVACNSVISNKSVKLLCKGLCGLYYHSECVVLSTDDSSNLDKYGKLESWKCVLCKVASSPPVSTHLTQSSVKNMTVTDTDYVCQCFQHIQILTDQIFELSRNQSEMRKQLSDIQDENFKLKASLSMNVDPISADILNRDVSSSYAAKVKLSNKSQTIEDKDKLKIHGPLKQTKLDALSKNGCTSSSASSQTKKEESQHNLTRSNVSNTKRPSIASLSSAIVVDDNCIGDKVFKEVTYKRKQNTVTVKKLEVNRPKTKRKSQGKFLTGSSSKEHHLSFVETTRYRYLFVSRFSTNVDCDALTKFIKDEIDCDFSVDQLKNRYPNYHSFKVGVPLAHWDKIFVPDFWPQGVYVSRFWFSKNHGEGPRSGSEGSFLEKGQSSANVT